MSINLKKLGWPLYKTTLPKESKQKVLKKFSEYHILKEVLKDEKVVLLSV
jgi:hypothetical protein